MTLPSGVFAAADVQDTLFLAIRVAAGVGGAFLGWLAAGPATRLLYRAAFQRPVPTWLLPYAKMGGALALGFVLFYCIPLGGGFGLGWGPGGGGGLGLGPGPGDGGAGDKKGGLDNGAPDKKDAKFPKPPDQSTRTPLEIELISSAKYKQDGKYYLIKRAEPAFNLAEVEDYFQNHHQRLEVHIILTDQSVGTGQGAMNRLRELTKKYKIPTVEPPE